jgi:hypothetical protein
MWFFGIIVTEFLRRRRFIIQPRVRRTSGVPWVGNDN